MAVALFPTRFKAALAAVASLLTVCMVFAYLTASSEAKPSMSASVAQSGGAATVSGVVKTKGGKPMQGARVLVRVRDADDKVVARLRPRIDKRGRFRVVLPRRAAALRVVIAESRKKNARKVNKLFFPKAGEAITVTAVFPARRATLLPGLFPY